MFKFRKTAILCLSACALSSLALGISACDEETVTPCTHPHEHATTISSDAEQHWYACQVEGCSEKIGATAHVFDDGVIVTPPSDIEGEMQYTCIVCNYKKSEIIDKVSYLSEYNDEVLIKAGAKGSTYEYPAQNPGKYIVSATGDALSRVSVWSDDPSSIPASVNGEGILSIEVTQGSTVFVQLTQAGTSDAYATVTLAHDKYASMQTLAYLEHFPTQTLSVPVGGRAFGRFVNVTSPVSVSWESENLALTINGQTYTSADCPISIERNTFNPSGIYFVATMLDGGLSEEVDSGSYAIDFPITLTKGVTTELSTGAHTVSVAKSFGSTYTYVAMQSGVYTFLTTDQSVSNFNVSASDAIFSSDSISQAGSVSIAVTKGEEIAVNIAHSGNATQEITFHVTHTPFPGDEVASLTVPNVGTSATTKMSVTAFNVVTTTLPAGSYTFNVTTSYEDNEAYLASARIWIDGIEYNNDSAFTLFKDCEVVVYTLLLDDNFEKVENVDVSVSITLTSTTTPETVTAGAVNVHLPSLNEDGAKSLYFVAETAGIYVISLTPDEDCMITANDGSWMLNAFMGSLSVSFSLQAGEAVSFTVTSLLNETGDVHFIIA